MTPAIVFLLNLLLGLLAGWLTLWVAGELRAPRPVAVIAAVIVGFLVVVADIASRIAA